jgi:hypothetical protein
MVSRTLTLAAGLREFPNELTYKLIYQIKGYSQEGRLLSQFHGRFGIADVIGYHECGTDDPHGCPSRFFQNAQFWKFFEKNKGSKLTSQAPEPEEPPEPEVLPKPEEPEEPPKPEERVLQCIALSAEGKALINVDPKTVGAQPSPGEVLESILHAIIGE